MSIEIKVSGNLEEELERLQKAAKQFEGNHQVSFGELFTSEFMKNYTQFESIEELISAGGFVVNSEDDFEAIPDNEMDAHVSKTTNFDSWEEMLSEAVKLYTARQLGF